MLGVNDIVITGIGCVTPVGIGREAYWRGLRDGNCGVKRLHTTDDEHRITYYGAAIEDFDGKTYVSPRKALKVMSREVQLAYSSSQLAWEDANLGDAQVAPDRMGVLFGAEMISGDHEDLIAATRACFHNGQLNVAAWGTEFSRNVYPLWMLRNLPNMPACHVGIAIDARGPNNSILQEEVSSLLAISEAASVIERDQADLMVVGAVGSRITPTRLIYRAPGIYDQHPIDDQLERCIPFDARRRGIVPAEGAGTLIIERRSHAVRRGARIYGVVRASSSRCGQPNQVYGGSSTAIASAALSALERSGLSTSELSHVSAQGFSEATLDIAEATAIRAVAPGVPVTAYSSYLGTAGAACGMLELIASLLAARENCILPTLGYRQPDPACDIDVCSHKRPLDYNQTDQSHFLKLSFTPMGQAAAVVIQCVT
jgi:3-oxoacyl-[acyl-carrier-protein] synthase II